MNSFKQISLINSIKYNQKSKKELLIKFTFIIIIILAILLIGIAVYRIYKINWKKDGYFYDENENNGSKIVYIK